MEREKSPKLNEITVADNSEQLCMKPSEDIIPRLCTLMQKGCFVKVQTGCSLRELLNEQFNISPEYVKHDIKVLFLDYSPVDDLDAAIIKDGAILALSAAMPGLVGAAMRKDGLSWMRTSITYHEEGGGDDHREGVLHVKLFNQVMADLGESFLRRGVYMKSKFLADYLERFDEEFWQGCLQITRNGDSVARQEMLDHLKAEETWVKFSIQ